MVTKCASIKRLNIADNRSIEFDILAMKAFFNAIKTQLFPELFPVVVCTRNGLPSHNSCFLLAEIALCSR